MSAFQPDGLFLKRSGNGYKGKVLQYNSAAVVDAHVEHGYLVQSSIEDDLSRLGVQRLKEALKGKGLPTSGNKGALVDRILAEFAESEISALPLEPRLLLTELGEAAVEQYETAAQKKRIEQALHLADLISSQAFAAAAADTASRSHYRRVRRSPRSNLPLLCGRREHRQGLYCSRRRERHHGPLSPRCHSRHGLYRCRD